jgi:hypothetical protein
MALHVVPPGPAPDDERAQSQRRVKAMAKPAAMLQCPRCGGRETIETRTGVMLVDGKPRGGTKSLICAACHRGGQRVVIL